MRPNSHNGMETVVHDHDSEEPTPDDALFDDGWVADPFELCPGCPDCDLAAGAYLLGLELDLRSLSLELWVAGWTPDDLIAEVRRHTGSTGATALVAQALIVDDSHRSDQARPESWRREIEALRARTGVDDVAIGWLVRWVRTIGDAPEAAECLRATANALGDLVDPLVVA